MTEIATLLNIMAGSNRGYVWNRRKNLYLFLIRTWQKFSPSRPFWSHYSP